MTKNDLIKDIAYHSGFSQDDTKAVINDFLGRIGDELANGGEVRLDKFGIFSVSQRAARDGRNPSTGEPMRIAASKNVKFKASSTLRGEL